MPYAAYEVTSREHGPSYKTVKEAGPTAYYGRAVTERQQVLGIKTAAIFHDDFQGFRGVEAKKNQRGATRRAMRRKGAYCIVAEMV